MGRCWCLIADGMCQLQHVPLSPTGLASLYLTAWCMHAGRQGRICMLGGERHQRGLYGHGSMRYDSSTRSSLDRVLVYLRLLASAYGMLQLRLSGGLRAAGALVLCKLLTLSV